MTATGVKLRAFMHVRELFAFCEELGVIDTLEREKLEAFADAE